MGNFGGGSGIMKRKIVLGYILKLECSESFTKYKQCHPFFCFICQSI